MDSLWVADIIVASYIVKEFRHQFGGLDISLGFLCKLYFLNSCKRSEKFKVFPQQRYAVLVPVILLGVVGYDMNAIARDVEARRLLGDLGIVAHSVNYIIHCRAITGKSIDPSLAIGDEILYKNGFAVFSKIARTVLGAAHLAVAISGEDTQKVIDELRRRSAALTELLQSIGSLHLRI